MKKPKILLTNDDGIFSLGLRFLWEAIADYADAYIIAPASDKSGSGLGVTFTAPLQAEQVPWEKNTLAWKVTGTPADCIKLGLSVLLEEKPDLILSGINYGSNSGRTVLYSGTVGGVIEGSLRSIPGIAFSHNDILNPDFAAVQKHILPIVKHILENPLPLGTILNVNFPEKSKEFKGIKMARQGRSYWIDSPDARIHPMGTPYFWLGGKWAEHQEHEESDVALLEQGYITAVPIHIDELTDHSALESHKKGFDALYAPLD